MPLLLRSLPTLGCYITASWDNQIKFLKEPSFYKSRHHDKPASTPTQHYTHTNTHASAFVSFMMQTKAEITESSGSVEEHALQRWSYADKGGGKHGAHTQKNHPLFSLNPHSGFVRQFGKQIDKQRHPSTVNIMHSQSLNDMDKLFILQTLVHTASFVSTASCGGISVASSSAVPATGSKKGKRINCWSTSQFRLLLHGWSRGRWDNAISCLWIPTWCNVSQWWKSKKGTCRNKT